jgi:multidrug efflux pump subunit AcrA (membrane-fusion protein)
MIRMLATAAVAALCFHGCAGGRDKDDDHKRPRPRVKARAVVIDESSRAALSLEVAAAVEDDLPDVRVRYGRVIPRPGDELVITSPVTGRVTWVSAHAVGDQVAANAELVTVTPVLAPNERAALGVQAAELGAQTEQAEHDLALREAELTRAEDLARDGVVSQAKLQEARAAAANARAHLAAARQGRQAHAAASGRATSLTAPAEGTLVSQGPVLGSAVTLGEGIARVLRAGPRRIDLSTGVSDPVASAYEVHLGDGWVPARMVARGMTVSDDGNRHDVLELQSSGEAPLGSTVVVRLAAASARGIVVPDAAVLPSAGGDVVYVERAHGAFEPRLVQIAARFAGKLRLAAGIKPGESIVVRGASALRGEALRSALGGEED